MGRFLFYMPMDFLEPDSRLFSYDFISYILANTGIGL